MKKIIPIILICVAAFTLFVGATGLILISTAISAPQIAPIGAAAAIGALVCAMLCGGLCVLFKRDILCRIAFFITLGGFACAVASVIIWLIAL